MYIYDSHRADKSARYIRDEPLGLHIKSVTVATSQGKLGIITHWEISYFDMLCVKGDTQQELVQALDSIPKRAHLDYERPHYYARAKQSEKAAERKLKKAKNVAEKEPTDENMQKVSELEIELTRRKELSSEALEKEKGATGTAKSILIYTDNTDCAYGFLQNFCHMQNDENFVKLGFDYSSHIEIRSILPFVDSVDEIRASLKDQTSPTSQVIAKFAYNLFKEIFIPEKQFFITPGKRTREHIQKKQRHYKDFTALEVFPKTFSRYRRQLNAYFGGVGYAAYQNTKIEKDMIILDIKSSHPYELFTSPHAIKQTYQGDYRGDTDIESLKNYAKTTMSIGIYEITYEDAPLYLKQFSTIPDEKGNRNTTSVLPEKTTDSYCFTNIDLLTFIEGMEKGEGIIYGIVPLQVTEFKSGNIPLYLKEVIYEEYLKKSEMDCLKNTPDEWRRDQQKVVVNGIGGSCAKKITESAYGREMKKSRSAPVWAIFMAAYGRRSVIELGTQLKGWVYSDTDSIICLDCPENIEKVEAYNKMRQKALKNACKKDNFKYEPIAGLGSFEIENHIKKIRINCFKQYGYITTSGKPVIKASGLSKERKKDFDYDKFFDHGELPFGSCPVKVINPNKIELVIDGVEIVSDGFYYEDSIDFAGDIHTVVEKLKHSQRSHF